MRSGSEKPAPRTIFGAAVNVGRLLPERSLPLLVKSLSPAIDLRLWAAANRQLLAACLLERGGILFRGFDLKSVEEFEQLIKTLSGRLLDYTYRSTPRTLVKGKIYTSTEYPPDQSIPLHNENAYARDWPMKIWFFSLRCAATGGETPIADSRRVYRRIPARIRERFARRGLMYVRNYGTGLDLSWQEVFQTTNKTAVENYCGAAGMKFEWLADDRLRTRQVCQAVAVHPETGEMVWFNQAQLFHVSRLRSEIREALLSIFEEKDLPRNVYFGDGSQIEDSDLDAICEAYEQEKVVFPWRDGDVLLLDNMLSAHARNPFTGPRQVVVGMAEAYSERD